MSLEITTLPSGLRIVTDTMRDLETTSLGVWVNAGSRHEAAHEHGLSHLLEHMAFKGTHRRSARVIAEDMEAAGGDLNAATSVEHTAYYARVLGSDAGLALDIIADILTDSVFEEDELTREKNVILQEIGETQDTPDDLVFDLLNAAAFPDQAIGRPILGTPETVSGFNRGAIQAYLDRHYAGPISVVAAAGAVDHARLVEESAHRFSTFQPVVQRDMIPAIYQGGQKLAPKRIEQTHLVVGFGSVSFRDPMNYAAHVFAQAVGGGMSSRLFQDVRERRGLAYSVYSFQWGYEDTGLFGFYAATGPKDVAEVMKVSLDCLMEASETLTEVEINRAKAQMKVSLLTALESPSARAEQIARHMLAFGRVIDRTEIIEKIDTLSLADVLKAGQTILATETTVAAVGSVGKVLDPIRIKERVQKR